MVTYQQPSWVLREKNKADLFRTRTGEHHLQTTVSPGEEVSLCQLSHQLLLKHSQVQGAGWLWLSPF